VLVKNALDALDGITVTVAQTIEQLLAERSANISLLVKAKKNSEFLQNTNEVIEQMRGINQK
jgi:hypothetical protein